MKVTHLFLSLLLVSGTVAAEPWARVAGGAQADSLSGVVVNPKGTCIAVGYSASIGGSNRKSEGWLVAHDPTGKLLWQKALGLDGADYAGGLTLTSEGGYVLLGSERRENEQPDLWIVKLDPKYKIQWWRLIGGAGWDSAANVIQTADGGYLIAGITSSFGMGSADGWLVRLDANGDLLWQRTYGGVDWESLGKVVERPDGTFLACGTTQSFGSGGEDMWLLSLNASGGVLWARTYGGASNEWCGGMLVDADGFIMLVGYYGYSENKAADAWILRLRTNGAIIWKKRYGGEAEFEVFTSIVRISNGNYLVAGYTGSYDNGADGWDIDGWVMEIDQRGRAVWQRTYGGEGIEYFYGLVAISDNEYLAVGNTSSGAGEQDGWFMGFDANGIPSAACTELSRPSNVVPRGSPGSSRSISVTPSTSSAALLSRPMHIKKASLPTSDPCGTRLDKDETLAHERHSIGD